MTDPDMKFKHSLNHKRNMMAKHLRDSGDHKGAFSLRVISPKKTQYKRTKIRKEEIFADEEDG